MKKYTIQDLREGSCAVENDGTLEELREVLKKAFPDDKAIPKGGIKFYYLNANGYWKLSDGTNLPIQSVKDFLIEDFSPKRGDRVLVRDSEKEDWEEVIYLATIEGAYLPFVCLNIDNESDFKDGKHFVYIPWKQMKPIESVKEMTLEEVCKELGREVKIVKG